MREMLTTERLLLRPLEPDDIDARNEVLGDPEAMRDYPRRSPDGRRPAWLHLTAAAPSRDLAGQNAPVTTRTILHVDLDAFFAAVEQRDRPELRGRPVIVGGGAGDRGVVSAASYEARTFGVHSAMPLRIAAARCPDGVFLPVDGRKYQRASREVMAILRRFTPMVEPISIDEAFLDVTGSAALFGDGETIGRRIRDAIREEVGLTASVGVATSKLVAKVASDLRKPDALVVVPPGSEAAFLAPLPITRLWGVGEKSAVALAELGVQTIGDLAALPGGLLERRFGRHGASLAERARGIDVDPVGGGEAAKSIGHEHTFDRDTADAEEIERTLLGMADGVAGRLRSAGILAGTVTLKLRDSSFHTITRQVSMPEPTDLAEPIYRAVLELLRRELHGQRIRLVGVSASNFREPGQLALFSDDEPRRHRTAEALDRIRRKYGAKAVTRARLVGADLPAPFERDPRSSLEARGTAALPPEDRERSMRRERAMRRGPAASSVPDADPPQDAADRDSQGDTDAPDDRFDEA
jgi:DNA polymerase IV